MKTKHVILALCLLYAGAGHAQNKLFEKYAEMDGVTSIYISKAMFQMIPGIKTNGIDLAGMKGKIESLQLVTTEKQEYIPRMRNEFTQLVGKQHQELMRIKNDGTRVTFYSDMDGERIKDLLLVADGDSSFTVIYLVGNLTLQDIEEISKITKQ
jgi:hypothetical protein